MYKEMEVKAKKFFDQAYNFKLDYFHFMNVLCCIYMQASALVSYLKPEFSSMQWIKPISLRERGTLTQGIVSIQFTTPLRCHVIQLIRQCIRKWKLKPKRFWIKLTILS